MFQLRFGGRELSRRIGRTVLTALGLAAGVGLVIGILGISRGLDDAQGRVLSPLKSVGTDVLVTRVIGANATASGPAPTQTGGDSGNAGVNSLLAGGSSGFFGGDAGSLNADDAASLV